MKTEDEADEFPLDDEAQEALVASHHVDLLEAIEDEILLAIPSAPKHPMGDCQMRQAGDGLGDENPFKVLNSLKK